MRMYFWMMVIGLGMVTTAPDVCIIHHSSEQKIELHLTQNWSECDQYCYRTRTQTVFRDGVKYRLVWTARCWCLTDSRGEITAYLDYSVCNFPDQLPAEFVIDRLKERIHFFEINPQIAFPEFTESKDLHPLTLPDHMDGRVWTYSLVSLPMLNSSFNERRELVIVDREQKKIFVIGLSCKDKNTLNELWDTILRGIRVAI